MWGAHNSELGSESDQASGHGMLEAKSSGSSHDQSDCSFTHAEAHSGLGCACNMQVCALGAPTSRLRLDVGTTHSVVELKLCT